MGRFCGRIPDNDPSRLARILDEKRRMIGVDKEALDKQVQERRYREALEANELKAFAQQASDSAASVCQASQASEHQRKLLNKQIDDHRKQQMEERRAREAKQRELEQAASREEQQCALSSPWLNEDIAVQQSALGPNRVRRDHFKHMSEEQLRSIREAQAQQVAAKAAQLEAECRQQEEYDAMQAKFVETMSRNAAQAEAATRQEALRVANELQRQILEKQGRDASLGKLYTNTPGDGYFAQFGTSHR